MRRAACLLSIVAALACSPPATALAQQAAPPDPAGPGPYAVGVTMRSFQRVAASSGLERDLDTLIWYPANPSASDGLAVDPALEATPDAVSNSSGGPFPVVTWSHGYTVAPTDYQYFIAHLASYGFVVLAPFHRGTSQPGPSCPAPCTDQDGAPADWLTDRPDDLGFVLGQSLALSAGGDPILGGLLDAARVGGAGHSFGGWTTLALMARQHPYRAAVAMAPGAPGNLSSTLPVLAAADTEPLMMLAASLDSQTGLAGLQRIYAAFPGPSEHWLVTLQRAGHKSFMNQCVPGGLLGIPCSRGMPDDQAHVLIDRWATAFLLRWVAGDPRYGPYLNTLRATRDPALQITVSGT